MCLLNLFVQPADIKRMKHACAIAKELGLNDATDAELASVLGYVIGYCDESQELCEALIVACKQVQSERNAVIPNLMTTSQKNVCKSTS